MAMNELYIDLTIPKKLPVKDGNVLMLERFQEDAVERMSAHFTYEGDGGALGYWPGLVVMPTGSGKTRTSVCWMMRDKLKNGYKVLWLSHRSYLLEQTAHTMFSSAGSAIGAPKDPLVLRCVSSKFARSSTASFQNEDILVFSILSLARRTDLIQQILSGVKDSRLLVVIDEAHHSIMNSYVKVLQLLSEQCPGFILLGLTATPTRMSESERNKLFSIFGNRAPIYQITMGDLIENKFLAKPEYERIDTQLNMIENAKLEDTKWMEKWKQIPEDLLIEIANNTIRNQIIVDKYEEKHHIYGQTLVFTVNKRHCETLAHEFNIRNISCDFVYSGKVDNDEVLERFRRKEIKVLLNVEIMTEGVDIPQIQTVFLTRPTASDTLLMQMIGRGLRGPKSGGTENAYIVDFHDNWERFDYWLDPEFVLEGEFAEEEPKIDKRTDEAIDTDKSSIPWELVLSVYDYIKDPVEQDISFSNIIPIGWYVVPDTNAEDGEFEPEERRIMVFANQFEAYQEMEKHPSAIIRRNGSNLLDLFFHDIPDPLPKVQDMEALSIYVEFEGKMPELYSFAERDRVDPNRMALYIREKNYTQVETRNYLKQLFESSSMVRRIYKELSALIKAVNMEFLIMDGDVIPECRPMVIDPEVVDLTPGPHHDLNKLYEDVLKERFENRALPISNIEWSRRPVKSYFGKFRYGDRKMLVNKVLDSPDVPEEVVKFIIYHEQLHAEGKKKHNDEFYLHERKYPGYEKWDQFLDTMREKYTTEAWEKKHEINKVYDDDFMKKMKKARWR